MLISRFVTGTFFVLMMTAGCGSDTNEESPANGQEHIDMEDIEDTEEVVDEPGAAEQEVIDQQREERQAEENALPEEIEETDPVAEHAGMYDQQNGNAEPEANAGDSADEEADRDAVTISRDVINPEYENLLNEDNELVVSGRTVDELLDLIGEPPHMLRQGHRGSGWHKEVWILPIYQEDSTGLYIYIENGQVADWRLDTFVGIGSHEQLLDWF